MKNGYPVNTTAENLIKAFYKDLVDVNEDLRHDYIMCVLMRAIMVELDNTNPVRGDRFYSELSAVLHFMLCIEDFHIDNDHKLQVIESVARNIKEDVENGN